MVLVFVQSYLCHFLHFRDTKNYLLNHFTNLIRITTRQKHPFCLILSSSKHEVSTKSSTIYSGRVVKVQGHHNTDDFGHIVTKQRTCRCPLEKETWKKYNRLNSKMDTFFRLSTLKKCFCFHFAPKSSKMAFSAVFLVQQGGKGSACKKSWKIVSQNL